MGHKKAVWKTREWPAAGALRRRSDKKKKREAKVCERAGNEKKKKDAPTPLNK